MKKQLEFKYNSEYSLKAQLSDDLDLTHPTSRYHLAYASTINRWLKFWNSRHTIGFNTFGFSEIKTIYKNIDNISLDEDGLGIKMYINGNLQFHFTKHFGIDYSLFFCWFAIYELDIRFCSVVEQLANNLIDDKLEFKKQQNEYYKERQKVLRIKVAKKDKSKTYVMKDEDTGFYKIGKSVNPEHRERTLQSQKPTIKMVKIFDSNIEKELHEAYDKYRVRGEWFNLTNIQLQYICTHYK
jgi:hypothetical protein